VEKIHFNKLYKSFHIDSRCSTNNVEKYFAFYINSKTNLKYTNITYDLNTNQFKRAFQIAKQKQKYVSKLVN